MQIEKKETFTHFISDENSFSEFYSNFLIEEKNYTSKNVVIQFSNNINISTEEFLLFLDISVQKNLERDELTALYFWVLNKKYMRYLEGFDSEYDTFSVKEFDREFGRSLAYKIYEPKDSGLGHETIEELKLLLCDFASEFDLSVMYECTTKQIVEVIDMYCSASNNTVPVF
mgnify:CR=1 FL=1